MSDVRLGRMGRVSRAGVRGDIQGMRALAVGLVVLSHAGWPAVAGGYVGVDVFFVISGFLITGLLGTSLRETGRIGFGHFYARRALRILPIATVVLVTVSIASAFVYTSGRLHQVLGDSVWAALFGLNIRYAGSDTSYFGTDDFVSPLQHFWSLAVEEQFYLFWPLLVAGGVTLAGRVMRRRLGPVGPVKVRVVGLRYAGLAILALCLVSLAWSWHRSGSAPLAAYFSTFTRVFELGAGAFLALIAPWCRRRSAPVKALWSWTGLAAILLAATTYTDTTRFPGVAALLPVVGSALVLAGGIDGPRYGAALLLDRAPARRVGDISFSFYLWHWPLLILPAAYLGRDLSVQERIAAVAVAFTLAALSYRWVEQPFRDLRRPQGYRLRALVLWPVALSLVLGTSTGVRAYEDWHQDHEPAYVRPDVDPEPTTKQASADDLVNDVGFAGELARASYPLPDTLLPSLPDLQGDITTASGYRNDDQHCFATTKQVATKVCRTGKADASGVVVALGDSHMGMWLAPITKLAADHDLSVVPLLKQRCLPFDLLQWDPTRKRPYDECAAHDRWALRQVRRIKPEVIVVSALYQTSLVDPGSRRVVPRADDDRVFAAGVRTTLRRLHGLAPHVLVIGPTPLLPKPAADCLASRRANSGTCKVSARGHRTADRDRMLARIARQEGVGYLSMLSWICDAKGTCPLVIGNRIVYRDDNHVTETYAEHLLPVFAKALRLR